MAKMKMLRLNLGQLLLWVGLLASVILIATMVGDFNKSRHLLNNLHIPILIAVIFLALADHVLRYWRWELLLKKVALKEA